MRQTSISAAVALILSAVSISTSNAQVAVDEPATSFEYGEELLRGPVHEAFAEQYNQEPIEGLIVDRAPPPPVPEVPPELRPQGDKIEWVSGYWFWDEDRTDFIWISGVWRQMPPGQRWVPGYWAEVGGQHQWVSGTWVATTVAEVDYIVQSPPESLDLGPVGNAPSEQHFWIPGCWNYRDASYAWRPGYWSIGQTNWVWVPLRYLWTPRGYVFCNGYWDYPIVNRGTLFAPFYFNRPIYINVGFRHAPRLSIFASALQAHFWVSPRRHHYYFGDYYASSYRGSGFYPWHSFHRHSMMQIGGRNQWGYDPLFAHSSRIYGCRGTDLTLVLGNQYNLYVNQADRRPPRTYGEQIGRSPWQSHDYTIRGDRGQDGRQQDDSFWTRSDVLGESIRDRASREPSQFSRVTNEQIDRYREQAGAFPQLASLRREVESQDRGRFTRPNDGTSREREDRDPQDSREGRGPGPSSSSGQPTTFADAVRDRDSRADSASSQSIGAGRWRLPPIADNRDSKSRSTDESRSNAFGRSSNSDRRSDGRESRSQGSSPLTRGGDNDSRDSRYSSARPNSDGPRADSPRADLARPNGPRVLLPGTSNEPSRGNRPDSAGDANTRNPLQGTPEAGETRRDPLRSKDASSDGLRSQIERLRSNNESRGNEVRSNNPPRSIDSPRSNILPRGPLPSSVTPRVTNPVESLRPGTSAGASRPGINNPGATTTRPEASGRAETAPPRSRPTFLAPRDSSSNLSSPPPSRSPAPSSRPTMPSLRSGGGGRPGGDEGGSSSRGRSGRGRD